MMSQLQHLPVGACITMMIRQNRALYLGQQRGVFHLLQYIGRLTMRAAAGLWLILGLVQFALTLTAYAAAPGDYNSDGRISQEEFRNQAAKEAAEADRNGDGVLTDDEYDLTNAEAAAMDTNKDGRVQVSELRAALMRAFAQMDKNGDGYLDAGERRAK